MKDKFDYKITLAANEDLQNIGNYFSYVLLNPKAAHDFLIEYKSCIDKARTIPQGFPVFEWNEYKNKDIRKLIIRNYVVLFQIKKEDEQIIVLRVLYGAQDLQQIKLYL